MDVRRCKISLDLRNQNLKLYWESISCRRVSKLGQVTLGAQFAVVIVSTTVQARLSFLKCSDKQVCYVLYVNPRWWNFLLIGKSTCHIKISVASELK